MENEYQIAWQNREYLNQDEKYPVKMRIGYERIGLDCRTNQSKDRTHNKYPLAREFV
jgi:hypothetical protein